MYVNIHFYGDQSFWNNVLVIFTHLNILTINFSLAAKSTPNAKGTAK